MVDEITADEPELDPLADVSKDYISSRVTVTLKCGYCGEVVGSSSGVGKKVYTHGCKCETTTKLLIEKEVIDSPHTCPQSECERALRTEEDLRQHMEEEHDVLTTVQAVDLLNTVEETHPELTRAVEESDEQPVDKIVAVAYSELNDSSVEDLSVITRVAEDRYL